MYARKNILVITTDSPAGAAIERHLEPITAHVVAGTNMFSDIFAGMSDIFGGRSGTYKKQLNSIYSEAIERLKSEAIQIGADAIVGLKIDIDEVSGGGKSMFMITAIGTAVVLSQEKSKPETTDKAGLVSNNQIETLHKLKKVQKKADNELEKFTFEEWEFIISERVSKAFPGMIKRLDYILENSRSYTESDVTKYFGRIKEFLLNLPEAKAISLLYDVLNNPSHEEKVYDFALKFIKENELVDLHKTAEILAHDEFEVRKRGVKISTYKKRFYTPEDLELLAKISDVIDSSFDLRGEKTTVKQLLRSKEKEAWKCECGKVNDITIAHCEKCLKDIYGFTSSDVKPAAAKTLLNNKIILIKELFENDHSQY